MIKNIGLDFGHGGKDTGATGWGFNEKDIVLSIGMLLNKKLIDNGFKTCLTRADDSYISLNKRCEILNKCNTDFNISIHVNKYSVPSIKGMETWYFYNSKEGKKLAQSIQTSTWKNFEVDRKIKPSGPNQLRNLYILRGTKKPTILLELGFISNFNNLDTLNKHKDKITDDIIKGIKDYIGPTQKHWADKHFNSLIKKGYDIKEKRYNDYITRGEIFALLDKKK